MPMSHAERQIRYRARQKEKREKADAEFAAREAELAAARGERLQLLQAAGTLQTELFERTVSQIGYSAHATLSQGGPGWSDYHLQVAANMTQAQYYRSWCEYSAMGEAALAAGASDDALACLVTKRETLTTHLARLRFDLVLSLLATNFAQPPERVQAHAQAAASAIAQTISWEQRERVAYLYTALQRRVRAGAVALGTVACADEAVGFLELWGTSTLSGLWSIFEACRNAMTPRQRVIVAALYRDFFPDPITIIQLVHCLAGSSPPRQPTVHSAPPLHTFEPM